MSAEPCAAHPEVPAAFRCEGCGRFLCEGCVEEGHRLFFCRHCRERALPCIAGAGDTPSTRRRALWLARPYPLREALTYPFHGRGRTGFVAYVASLLALDLLGAVVPGMALISLVTRLIIQLLVPGMVFLIVRTSAEGEIELPDWPDFASPVELFTGWYRMAGVLVAALLPMAFFFRLGGCEVGRFLFGLETGECWPGLLSGVIAATAIGAMGVGACGTYDSGWLSFRLDLHLLALWEAGSEAWKTIGLVAAVMAGSVVMRLALGTIPLLGLLGSRTLAAYALFTGAHLVGVLFRRRRTELEAVYLG